MAGLTLYDKLWESHLVKNLEDGTSLIYIDLHFLHEVTSPQAFEGLRLAGRKPWRAGANMATPDHNVPTTKDERSRGVEGIMDPTSKIQVKSLDSNCLEFGISEFQIDDPNSYKLGQMLDVNVFSIGQKVDITGKSIGKGFAGLQKRHNFTRGPMTHGSKNHRAPGSIGMGTTPGRVLPGKKMAGQLGNKITTIKKLKIIQFNLEENILVIKGSVPGKPGNLLSIIPSN